MSRKTAMNLERKQDLTCADLVLDDQAIEEDIQSTSATPLSIVEATEYVVYSPTYQVPTFYFSMHDTSGHNSAPLYHSEC